MSGLKSGSGDDLWGDDSDDEEEETKNEVTTEAETAEQTSNKETTESTSQQAQSSSTDDTTGHQPTTPSTNDQTQSYLVRRAIQDKSVQFEREERLTFFVHDDVVGGERDLVTDMESTLGRDVPKFDIREAVYRAALRNRDDVLKELLEMGYSLDEE